MKKLCGLFTLLLLFSVLITGCSNTSDTPRGTEDTAEAKADESAVPNGDSGYSAGDSDSGVVLEENSEITETISEINSDKIIYSAFAQIESLNFDDSISQVYNLVTEYGGFVERSSVTGTNSSDSYYGDSPYRYASFTVRIPRDRFSELEDGLSKLGNVVEYTTHAENITSQYTDLEARLASLETQRERLMDMLEQAETVEDMITIDGRLSDVTYQMEALTASINNLDNQISYSTLTVNINEVARLTDTEDVGYWTDVANTLSASLSGTGAFFKAALKYLIAALPVIVIAAVIVIVLVYVRKRIIRSRNKKLLQNPTDSTSQDNPDDKNNI